MTWNVEQVLALAPDASSAKSGKDLSVARKWLTLGADDACAWGTLQGSGSTPYQAVIDLAGPAFKCTCPSRKFPCKHGLGLFLILAQQPDAFREKRAPAWASEWLAKRSEKQEAKAARAAAPAAAPDPETEARATAAAEKRSAAREAKVSRGLEDLGVWLEDVVRSGFASLPGKPSSLWQNPAARLVDAQAPGMARRLAELEGITTTGEDWPERLLRQLATLHLAREGWRRIGSLPNAAQSDLRAALGFTMSQDDVLADDGIRDHWVVAGQRVEEEERLRVQRTWLFGAKSLRAALCLSFSAGPNPSMDVRLTPGATVDAELAFFPSAFPLRALVKQRHGASSTGVPELPHATIAAANRFAADAFGANPWLERIAFALAAVVPLRRTHGWIVRDADGRALPLDIPEMDAWKLVALSGGAPVALAGEWNGDALRPMSVWAGGRLVTL
ncbi:MAG TPA: SWIM zinc finger family protein [Terriglobia bacterium]|nr:SWIM zinc finger family protein [Terriglobia bacterium]